MLFFFKKNLTNIFWKICKMTMIYLIIYQICTAIHLSNYTLGYEHMPHKYISSNNNKILGPGPLNKTFLN